MGKKVNTANTLRSTVGVGTIINTHHEGRTDQRKTEDKARLDEWKPVKQKTPWDFFNKKKQPENEEATEPVEESSEGTEVNR